MPVTGLTISAQPFDPADWSPYGWVPVPDTDPRDGSSRLDFEWADVHLNLIGHEAVEVEAGDRVAVAREARVLGPVELERPPEAAGAQAPEAMGPDQRALESHVP